MKNPDEKQLRVMTTNERLFVSGFLAQFDAAVAQRDLKAVRKLLEAVYVDEGSIEAILRKTAD